MSALWTYEIAKDHGAAQRLDATMMMIFPRELAMQSDLGTADNIGCLDGSCNSHGRNDAMRHRLCL